MKTNNHITFDKIKLLDGFWKTRYDINISSSIPSIKSRFERSRFSALNFLENVDSKKLHVFYDSDTAKWIESVAYILKNNRNEHEELEIYCDDLIGLIEKNQNSDGYFNSYFQQVEKDQIFKQRVNHELYCLGHLIEAGIAYYEATNKNKLINVTLKYIDYVEKRFIKKRDTAFVTPGHQELELSLLKLFNLTRNKRFLNIAAFFLENRGNNDLDVTYGFANNRYAQDNEPIRELKLVEGHSVRAMYLFIAMAKYAKIKKDKVLLNTLKGVYSDLITKTYITGGIGSTRIGEAFTIPYDLPNNTAYAESCASIGLIWFLRDLFEIDPKGEYHDLIERTLYNGFLSSTSLDGKAFFYENPLEITQREIGKDVSMEDGHKRILPITERQEDLGCSCCPPNITRFVAQIGDLIYSNNDKKLYINQYISSRVIIDNTKVLIDSLFPSKFEASIKIEDAKPHQLLCLRIPNWVGPKMSVSGDGFQKVGLVNGYLKLKLVSNSVLININFNAFPRFIEANPMIKDNTNKVALVYGPLVYCLEEVDNGCNLFGLSVNKKAKFVLSYDEQFQMNTINTEGTRTLLSNKTYDYSYKTIKTNLIFIPFYAFANRGKSDMLVWVNKN